MHQYTNDDCFWASPSTPQNRSHPRARGKPVVIDVLVDLHELSPMSFYRTLPSGRSL